MFGCFSSSQPQKQAARADSPKANVALVEHKQLVEAERHAAEAETRATRMEGQVEDLRSQVKALQLQLPKAPSMIADPLGRGSEQSLQEAHNEIQLLRTQVEGLTTSIYNTTLMAETSNMAHAKALEENQRLLLQLGELRASLAAAAPNKEVVEVHGHNEEVTES